MSRDYAVVSSVPEVAAAVSPHLPNMNAVDAVICGVLVAAARSPGVAMGSVQLSVGGPGTGFHAVDGRVRQPGFGVPRPRGFEDIRDIPAAARVAVPTFAPALAGTLGTFGTWTATQAANLAMPFAGKSARTAWLKLFGHRGGTLLVGTDIGQAVLVAGGRLAGGVVTQEDMLRATTEVRASEATNLGGDAWLHTIPWGEAGEEDLNYSQVVAAVDGRGTFAVATFEDRQDGVYVAELDMHLPGLASPVLRGVPRVRPGQTLGARAAQGILVRAGVASASFGLTKGAALPLAEVASNYVDDVAEHERAPGVFGVGLAKSGAFVR